MLRVFGAEVNSLAALISCSHRPCVSSCPVLGHLGSSALGPPDGESADGPRPERAGGAGAVRWGSAVGPLGVRRCGAWRREGRALGVVAIQSLFDFLPPPCGCPAVLT